MKNNLSIDYNNNPDNDSQSGGTVMEINALWEHRPLSSFDDEIQYRTVMVDGMEMTLNEMQLIGKDIREKNGIIILLCGLDMK